MKISVNADGGARGNPGQAAIGIVIRDNSNNIRKQTQKPLDLDTQKYNR